MNYIYTCEGADKNECNVGVKIDTGMYHVRAYVDGVLYERYYTPFWNISCVLRRFRATIQSARRA